MNADAQRLFSILDVLVNAGLIEITEFGGYIVSVNVKNIEKTLKDLQKRIELLEENSKPKT